MDTSQELQPRFYLGGGPRGGGPLAGGPCGAPGPGPGAIPGGAPLVWNVRWSASALGLNSRSQDTYT